jgi:hypothetical protein
MSMCDGTSAEDNFGFMFVEHHQHWVNTINLHADPEKVSCWPCHKLHDRQETCRPNKENNGAACISDISVETI